MMMRNKLPDEPLVETHDGHTWLVMMKKNDWLIDWLVGWLVGLGVLVGPGTPRDPKSHIFVTNWVAIQPFCAILQPTPAEFRRASRQIGPTPSIQLCFCPCWTKQTGKVLFFAMFSICFRRWPEIWIFYF